MMIPVALMIAAGTIGSIDGLYYHLYKFRLFERRTSRLEEVTHLIRFATFATGLWILAGHRPAGGWFWALAAIFTVEFVDSMTDVICEPRSRRDLGGIPPVEYAVHMCAGMATAAGWASFLILGWSAHAAPTALLPAESMPAWLVWGGRATALGAAGLGLLELTLFARALLRGSTAPPTEAVVDPVAVRGR